MKRFVIALNVLLVLGVSGLTSLDEGAAHQGSGPQAREAKPAPASATPADPAKLDALLAPIALYPDALLGQILLCAANPGKVAALDEWLRSHETLKGSELQDAAKASGFDASFVAIVLFPQVVSRMAGQLDWTTRLGKAFAADRSAVFDSIQRLRKKATDAGKLKDTPQQNIENRTTSSGQQVIVIEPANPQVVYVPQYNEQTVYVPTTTSSTVVVQSDDDSDAAVAAGLIGFTAGIALGAAIDNDYYYGPWGWHGGGYMYNDAWDDYYDHREDARDDWQDHREDLVEERGDRREDVADERGERARTQQEQRTERSQTRQENRPQSQADREQRRTDAAAATDRTRSAGTTSQESRGFSRDATATAAERSGTRSDALSGYSSGRSERAASQRGKSSRSSSARGGRRR